MLLPAFVDVAAVAAVVFAVVVDGVFDAVDVDKVPPAATVAGALALDCGEPVAELGLPVPIEAPESKSRPWGTAKTAPNTTGAFESGEGTYRRTIVFEC